MSNIKMTLLYMVIIGSSMLISAQPHRRTESGLKTCRFAVQSCLNDLRCKRALINLKSNCKVTTEGRCSAYIPQCAAVMDDLIDTWFDPKERCVCDPERKEKCQKFQEKVYDNPCFQAVTFLRWKQDQAKPVPSRQVVEFLAENEEENTNEDTEKVAVEKKTLDNITPNVEVVNKELFEYDSYPFETDPALFKTDSGSFGTDSSNDVDEQEFIWMWADYDEDDKEGDDKRSAEKEESASSVAAGICTTSGKPCLVLSGIQYGGKCITSFSWWGPDIGYCFTDEWGNTEDCTTEC